VTLGVYNEAGELVRLLTVVHPTEPCGDLTMSPSSVIDRFQGPGSRVDLSCGVLDLGDWDGTNAQGDPVSNGTYFLKVVTMDVFGTATGVTRMVLVQREEEVQALRVLDSAGELVRLLHFERMDPTNGVLNGLVLDSATLRPGDIGAAGTLGIVLVSTAGSVIFQWDGRTESGGWAGPGYYLIQAHWENGLGSQDLYRGVVVTGSAGNEKALVQPNILRPGSGTDTAAFSVVSGGNWTLKTTLFTLAGERLAEAEGDPNANSVLWKARGVASGLYLALVEARKDDGALFRETLKVLVIH
jgi:hypothetical protein